LVLRSLEKGWEVAALSRRTEWLSSIGDSRLRVSRWEAGEERGLRDALSAADAVCHLAAHVPRPGESFAAAQECLRVNALGTLHLLEIAAASRIGRFVDFSPGNAYVPRGRLATEDDPLYPSGRAAFYLTSKLAEEIFADYYRARKAFPVTILRLSSVYGPGMRPDSLVAVFVDRAGRGLPLEVHDGGTYAADLVYVEDVVEAALSAIEKGASGVFNVGSGVVSSTLDVARTVARIQGLGVDAIHVAGGMKRAVGYPALDVGKARRILGHVPTSLEDGIRIFVAALGRS
jgi:UDP-glucose 4-epimerase